MSANIEDCKTDRRVVRSRRLLSVALFELLQERRWDKISVQNIVERADIGRSTFYAHFETKFDLLQSQLPELTMPLDVDDESLLPDFTTLFEHIQEQGVSIRPVLAQPISGEITNRMTDQLAASWRAILAEHHPVFDDEITARYLAAATLATMRHYLVDPTIGTPREMSERLTRLVANTLSV